MINSLEEIKNIDDALSSKISGLNQRLTDMMVLQGKALAVENDKIERVNSLRDVEFKVFSQFGEDGIIQYLIKKAKISPHEEIFVEFGVQNYLESNTRFLLLNNNWNGLVIDGDLKNISFIKEQSFYWRNNLTAVHAWIDEDNINNLINDVGISGEIGILSIDIDGNDYWVWNKISIVNPVIVIIEYNSIFGSEKTISVPYSSCFYRTDAHYSNLYYGASISALEHLGKIKGYSLVGSNSAGNNLFFIRNDRLGELDPCTAKDAYVESKIRESRSKDGQLTFLSGSDRQKEIEDLIVIDVVTNTKCILKDIL